MEFKEFAERYRNDIYNKICEYVPIKEPEGHYRIIRDYIDRQGKYRRPALLLLTAYMYGATIKDAILPAAAMQISEDWILMQDDIEDDSELRRGKPAAHRLYGWVHALDASDTGHMVMWKMLKDYILQVGVEKGNRLYEKFYDMIQYTVEGQFIENTFIHDTKDLSKVGEDFYFRVIEGKTAYYTIYGPMHLGAIVGGASDKDLEMLREIGTKVAAAFQIMDDVLDLIADEKEFGKKNNGDLYEGKITLMVLQAYKMATPEEKLKMNEIYAKKRREKTEDEIMFVRGLIEKYKTIDYAKAIAEKHGEASKQALAKYKNSFPQNEYTETLLSAIEEMYRRKK